MECVSDSRVIRTPASPAEHGFPQLPAADPGDHIQVARDHHDPSSDRYLLAGHAIWQPLSVPVLELIPERADQCSSQPELGCKHSRDLACRGRHRTCLFRAGGQHSGDDSHPLAGRQAGANVPYDMRHQFLGLTTDHRRQGSAHGHLVMRIRRWCQASHAPSRRREHGPRWW